MSRALLSVVIFLCSAITQTLASEVSGRIIVEKKAGTRTLGPTVYELRGIALAKSVPEQKSTNVFERVAVWLESGAVAPGSPEIALCGSEINVWIRNC
jgi:hypothetical protein